MLAAKHRNGGRIIVADPRKRRLCARANLHLQVRAGTNVALMNGKSIDRPKADRPNDNDNQHTDQD